MKGATAYEYQIGRFGVRILRANCYFIPYRMYGKMRFPRMISFYIDYSHKDS